MAVISIPGKANFNSENCNSSIVEAQDIRRRDQLNLQLLTAKLASATATASAHDQIASRTWLAPARGLARQTETSQQHLASLGYVISINILDQLEGAAQSLAS